MKKQIFVSFLMVLALLLHSFFPFFASTVSAQTVETETLTNQTVLEMTRWGLPAEAIVEKIKASAVEFDLSSAELQNLKSAGVADAVIVAMLRASRTPGSSGDENTSALPETEVLIPDGTEIEVQLKNNLSGQEAKEGDIVDLVVVRNVTVDERVVIAEGATATARITRAKKAGYWGKSGKLEWAMQDVQTISNKKIPARFTKSVSGGSNSGTVAVGAVVTTVLLGPVGLLWGLKKGKKAIIPAGSRFSVFTDKDSTIFVKTAPVK